MAKPAKAGEGFTGCGKDVFPPEQSIVRMYLTG
jgi:hypothetical protein